jgi:hypothetical protein
MNNGMEQLIEEDEFFKRLEFSISVAWKLFQHKVSSGKININKEASMQLHYARILEDVIALMIYEDEEKVKIQLEQTVVLKNGKTHEVDIFVMAEKNNVIYNTAIEMKCFKEYASSGNRRDDVGLFMKLVYEDIEKLENYMVDNICQKAVFFAVTDDPDRLICPKNKRSNSKYWDYDISNNYHLTPQTIKTPIGQEDRIVTIKGEYKFNWIKDGKYFFLQL